MKKLDSKTCDEFQKRLKAAEASVRRALKDNKEDSALRSATEELINAHSDIRDLLQAAEAESSAVGDTREVVEAEIEIRREEHEMKPDAVDVLKAIFMWKDDPQERVSG